jgi:hypothetical protein
MFHICQNFNRGLRELFTEVVECKGSEAMAIV